MASGTDDTVDVGVDDDLDDDIDDVVAAIILKLFERGWYDDFIRL